MMHWYVVQAYSNFEGRVAEAIRENAKNAGLEGMFAEVIVPKSTVTEVRRGKKVKTERRFFPGYVFVQMEDDDRAFHVVRNTSRVAGFLGGARHPTPMSAAEAEAIMQQMEVDADGAAPEISFDIGEEVLVADGPFASFSGLVEQVDLEHRRLKVSVSIFGRATPVDLDFSQVNRT